MAGTFLLTWNPDKFPLTLDDWKVGWRWSCYTKKIHEGDRIFIIRVGSEPRGIFASGRAVSGWLIDKHWDDEKRKQGKTSRYVDIELDRLLDPDGDILDKEKLINLVSNKFPSQKMQWISQASGIEIPRHIAERLERVWARHSKRTVSIRVSDNDEPYDDDNALLGFEGGKKSRYVNYYERRPALRKSAIKYHGTACKVCGFNFGLYYGSRGEGFIEVHHLKPLSSLVEEKEINPITDMTVLCANCHRMAHRDKDNVLGVNELKKIWAKLNIK